MTPSSFPLGGLGTEPGLQSTDLTRLPDVWQPPRRLSWFLKRKKRAYKIGLCNQHGVAIGASQRDWQLAALELGCFFDLLSPDFSTHPFVLCRLLPPCLVYSCFLLWNITRLFPSGVWTQAEGIADLSVSTLEGRQRSWESSQHQDQREGGHNSWALLQSDIIPQVENPDFSVPGTILVEKLFSAPCNLLLANINTLEKRFILIRWVFSFFFSVVNVALLLHILARKCILRVSVQN